MDRLKTEKVWYFEVEGNFGDGGERFVGFGGRIELFGCVVLRIPPRNRTTVHDGSDLTC